MEECSLIINEGGLPSRYDNNLVMIKDSNDLINEAREEYELCIHQPQLYHQKVDSISNLFRLKGKDRLMGDNCPVYVVGKYDTAPIMMFGINPGYSKINNPREDHEARISWQNYVNLYQNFFTYFDQNKFRSPYYTSLFYLVSGLVRQKKYGLNDKWKLFDRYISNLELIPYHSRDLILGLNVLRNYKIHFTDFKVILETNYPGLASQD